MLPGPNPTIVTSGSSSTSSQTQSFSATSSSTSEPVRHGARKGNLVADFAAKPGPAASKVSIPRFQGERRQCGGDLGAAADRGRVHFNSSSYLYLIFKLEYIFHSCYYSYIFFSGGVHEDLVLPGLAEQPPCRLHLPRSRLWPTRHPLGE